MHILQVAITKSLQGRFKEFRRTHKPRRSMPSSSESKEVSGSKGRQIASTLPIPDGEDSVSFERHNRALKVEYNKVRPNKQVVEELMAQSFAMRWNDLHDNSYDVETVFEMYPFLADVSQVSLIILLIYRSCDIQSCHSNMCRLFGSWKGPLVTACVSLQKQSSLI